MAIKKPGVRKEQVTGAEPVAPSIRFAADQLIRKTRDLGDSMSAVIRAYIGEFKFIHLIDTIDVSAGKPIQVKNVGGIFDVIRLGGGAVTIRVHAGMRQIANGLWMPRDVNNYVRFGDRISYEDFLRATRDGPEDFSLHQKIGGAWVELENKTGSQSRVDTHAADTSTHGVAEVADVADLTAHKIETNTHGVSEIADAATLASHVTDTSTHGVDEVADVGTVADLLNDAMTTHEADTSTHGVAKVADDDGAGARVYRNSNQEIPNATDTIITAYNQEQYDTDSIHSTIANTSRLNCNTAGKYIITAGIQFEFDIFNAGIRRVELLLNGATVIARIQEDVGYEQAFAISTLYSLAADDYVEVRVYQNSGLALDVDYIAATSPYFAMQRISG